MWYRFFSGALQSCFGMIRHLGRLCCSWERWRLALQGQWLADVGTFITMRTPPRGCQMPLHGHDLGIECQQKSTNQEPAYRSAACIPVCLFWRIKLPALRTREKAR